VSVCCATQCSGVKATITGAAEQMNNKGFMARTRVTDRFAAMGRAWVRGHCSEQVRPFVAFSTATPR
jgi:hypothetical protein